MKLKIIGSLLLIICSLVVSAQEVEKTEKQKKDKSDRYGRDIEKLTLKKRGPNLDHYGHLYLGYGFIIGESERDSAEIIDGKSSAFSLGWLSKWRISRWYELGFDVTYHLSSYHIDQDSSKIVPNRVLHKKEKIVFNNIQVQPFQRIKLRNRYHSTGMFIDFGGYFGYNYRVKNQTVERDRHPQAGRTKTVHLRLKYTEDFEYGAFARIGFNRLMIYGRYRFSELFTTKSGLPDLPIYQVGIMIGIHQ